MTADDETDIRKTLLRSYRYISELLFSKKRDKNENYYLLSGLLRSLLCDSDNPYLLAYASQRKISLSIVSNIDYSIYDAISKGLVSYTNYSSLLPHWPSFNDAEVMPVQIFLESPLGVTIGNNEKGVVYCAKEIIKWCSNKDGISHYDKKKPKAYNSIKSTIILTNQNDKVSFIIQNIVYSLSYWTASAILYVLNKEESRQQIENEIKRRNGKEYILPATLNLIALYRLLKQSYLMTFFEGIHCYKVANVKQCDIENTLSLSTLMMIPENCNNHIMNIYTFIFDNNCILKIQINNEKLYFKTELNDINNETCIDIFKSIEYGKYFTLIIEISKNNSFEFSVIINEKKIYSSMNGLKKTFKLEEFIIGGNEKLNDFGLFFMNELIISKDGSLDISKITNYLWFSALIE